MSKFKNLNSSGAFLNINFKKYAIFDVEKTSKISNFRSSQIFFKEINVIKVKSITK